MFHHFQDFATQHEEVAEFRKENEYVSRTVQAMNPSFNINTATIEELSTVIERSAMKFHNELKRVATSVKMEKLIGEFYNEFNDNSSSDDVSIISTVDTSDDKVKKCLSENERAKSESGVLEYKYHTTEDSNDSRCNVCDDAHNSTLVHTGGEGNDKSAHEYNKSCELCKESSEKEYNVALMKWLEFPYHAVIADRLDLLEICIKIGYDMSVFRGEHKTTLLHAAVSKVAVNISIIEKLLECIPVNTTDKSATGMAIHNLIANGGLSEEERLTILKLFVEAGAHMGPQNEVKRTVLISYCKYLIDCVTTEEEMPLLKRFKAKYTSQSSTKHLLTSDRSCLDSGAWKQILVILSKSYINDQDEYDETALSYFFQFIPESATERKDCMTIVDYLLENGAEISSASGNNRLLLHKSAGMFNIDMVKYAIEHGCLVNYCDDLGVNPVYHACQKEEHLSNEQCDEILLPILEVLVAAGSEINTPAIDGTTPLHYCSHMLNANVCEFLLKNGAHVNASDHLRRTPMHAAARNEYANVVGILKTYGASINMQDKYGFTPLHYSAMYYNVATKALLDNGADVSIQCFVNKRYPLHVAQKDDSDIIDILIAAGANVNCVDKYGATPLHYAACGVVPCNIETLLKHGADTKVVDQLGNTPLSIALKMGTFEVSRLLTDNHNNDEYGILHYFSSLPETKVNDIENYFSIITEGLANIGRPDKICKHILSAHGFMRIDISSGENKIIHDYISSLAHAIATRIGEIDERFVGTVLACGSVSDGCKVGLPDEFDYLVNLEVFEDCIENIIPDTSVFTSLKVKMDKRAIISEFIDYYNCLDKAKLLRYFQILVTQALYDVSKTDYIELQCGHMLIKNIFSMMCNKHGLSPMIAFWAGLEYKDMVISFDINPVIRWRQWPLGTIKSSTLLPDLHEYQIYLFPKSPVFTGMLFSNSTSDDAICPNAQWSYSFVYVEQNIFEQLSESLKDGFSLIKSLRREPLVPNLIPSTADVDITDDISQFESQIETDCGETSYDRDLPVYKAENTLVESKQINHAKKVTEFDELEPVISEQVLKTSDPGTNNCSSNDENNAVGDDDDDNMFQEYNSDDDDIEKGENIISSYHLKQIFLHEVEKIPIEKRSDDSMVEVITYRVYKELLKCYQMEMIPSFFMREHNIYDTLDERSPSLKVEICKNIASMLEKLGFNEHE